MNKKKPEFTVTVEGAEEIKIKVLKPSKPTIAYRLKIFLGKAVFTNFFVINESTKDSIAFILSLFGFFIAVFLAKGYGTLDWFWFIPLFILMNLFCFYGLQSKSQNKNLEYQPIFIGSLYFVVGLFYGYLLSCIIITFLIK